MAHALTPAFADLLRRLPKTDLHCHVVGALRPGTLADLAHKHGAALPRPAATLYEFSNFYDFLEILHIAASVLRDREDFARLSYEVLEDGFRAGRMLHAELLFNPQYHRPQGVHYRTIVDGLTDGIEAARQAFGTSALLVASFDRIIEPRGALEILDEVLALRSDAVVGIGLDGAERNGPPARFTELYERAGRAGLKRTAHVCEDNQTLEEAPPQHYAVCHDQLHCDRLDHGYNLLADAAMVERARDDGLFFNVCTVTSVTKNLERRSASIGRMVDAGLRVTVNTDDPAMFKTDLADSYQRLFATRPDWGIEEARRFSFAGIDASWLDDSGKRRLRERFEAEWAALPVDGAPA
ncbi:MAG: Adenosine deaminase [Rhizobacter sp.]|nr:Adenosine deaminase [Rhizobacter sp.]